MLDIKETLLKACHEFVESKLETATKRIQSLQNDLFSETKSSAGDKHETARAMLHIEIEKAAQQLESIRQMKETLDKVNATQTNKFVGLGSLVKTNIGLYFVAISLGQIQIENSVYFIISTSSPIGKEFISKKAGDSFLFNGRKIQIDFIS